MKIINRIISFLFFLTLICGCSNNSSNNSAIKAELNNKTDSTITINIASCTVDEYPLSKLIDSVRYVALENSDSALIGIIKDVKVIKDLIYVFDMKNDALKCFDKNGKFIRNAFKHGGGPEEVGRIYDFDIDEEFLYVLDGAKVAIHIIDHKGNYVKNKRLPFRAEKLKCLSNNNFLFKLSPFALNNNNNPNVIGYTNNEFIPIKYFLEYIEGTYCGSSFENQLNSTYITPYNGNAIYERKDSSFFMKYYIDFNGKFFNRDKSKDGYKEAVEQGIYFTSSTLHNEKYLFQHYYAGQQREAVLFVNRTNNNALFIKSLVQDRNDVIDFTFSHTMGYDMLNNEFYGICNYFELSNITQNKENTIKKLEKIMPKKIQAFLLQENGDRKVNHILSFYKLKNQLHTEL